MCSPAYRQYRKSGDYASVAKTGSVKTPQYRNTPNRLGQGIFHVPIITTGLVLFFRAGLLATVRGCPASDTGESIATVTPTIYHSSACRVQCVTVNETLDCN